MKFWVIVLASVVMLVLLFELWNRWRNKRG